MQVVAEENIASKIKQAELEELIKCLRDRNN